MSNALEKIYRKTAILLVSAVFFFASCQTDYVLELPNHFPTPIIPDDNKISAAKIALGKKLFFDPNISIDSTVSCATCHKPEYAFADNVAISTGVNGSRNKRNATSLINAVYLDLVNKDGGVVKLDIQAVVPIEDEHEMNIPIVKLAKSLKNNDQYQKMFEAAYGDASYIYAIPRALASYIRTLVQGDSNYDRYIQGDKSALTDSQLRGKRLFESDSLACNDCHSGFDLTDYSFQNNGLYQLYPDAGRALITLDSLDRGKFRVASLRNVAVTKPYMYDGSIATLSEVIDHYAKGGQGHINQSEKIKGFKLSQQEKDDLISFLKSFTDSSYL